ncbi:uncharacterized protein TRIADDRAFT_22433, partial [Trichoplax adhaerens]
VWGPSKEIWHIVESTLTLDKLPDYHEFETVLKKYKPQLLSLFSSTVNRKNIKEHGATSGIQVYGEPVPRIFSQSFIEEALNLSDILDLNEYASMELLLASEHQKPRFPGLQRLPLAIILYYDGCRCLSYSLRSLIQWRFDGSNDSDLGEEFIQLVAKYTNDLMDEGITAKIMDSLKTLNIDNIITKILTDQSTQTIKYRLQLIGILEEYTISLAECLFIWSFYKPLSKNDSLKMIEYVRNYKPRTTDDTLNAVDVFMLATTLNCIDFEAFGTGENENIPSDTSHPLVNDATFLPEMHALLSASASWEDEGLRGVILMAWSLVLRVCSQQTTINLDNPEILEDDEVIMEYAVRIGALRFLRHKVIKSKAFYNEEFLVRRIHSLITGIIILMPLKIKEFRNGADESARIQQATIQEGNREPTDLRTEFSDFLYLIGELYKTDPLNLQLNLEYWCQTDIGTTYGATSMGVSYRGRPSYRQVNLFKFVRLAGDLLPAFLYVPYVEMLMGLATGPQAAYFCYLLLKSNSSGHGGGASVSWDHVFYSFKSYYVSLNESVSRSVSSQSQQIHQITPEELAGLEAILRLMQRIIGQDETARMALYENQHYMPMPVLFGLLSCVVPFTLKAEILLTLAGFAKSQEIAPSVWQYLESSQIIRTNSNENRKTGIEAELVEIESKHETYPETRAFITLLDNLTDAYYPSTFTISAREPGFQPYLNFLLEDVFLKFSTRQYRDASEKWQVASLVLKLFEKFMRNYEPAPEFFLENQSDSTVTQTGPVVKPPGHELFLRMLQPTPMLKLVLSVTYTAGTGLDELASSTSGRNYLEEAALYALRLMELSLHLEKQLFRILRAYDISLVVTPLSALLLDVNPHTRSTDHLLYIARFLTHGNTNPNLALSAVNILYHMCRSSMLQSDIITVLTNTPEIALEIMKGFVEHLETLYNEPNFLQDLDQEYIEKDTTQTHTAVSESILELLLYCLDLPAPSLAHFLLGYDVRKSVSKTILQDPGILGTPHTCLHAILTILQRNLDNGFREPPQIVEQCYHVIYKLCSSTETCNATIRYLRNNHEFFTKHLYRMPFANDPFKVIVLLQQSWLLKCIALELQSTSLNRQRSDTQNLVELLVSSSNITEDDVGSISTALQSKTFISEFSCFDAGRTTHQKKIRLFCLLDCINVKQDMQADLQLEFFDPTALDQAVQSCQQVWRQNNAKICNINFFRRILQEEVNNILSKATIDKERLNNEIQALLKHVVLMNKRQCALYAKLQAFEAWQEVVEVIFGACPFDLFQPKMREDLLLRLLQEILDRCCRDGAMLEIQAPAAGVVLALMAQFRKLASFRMRDTPVGLESSINSKAGKYKKTVSLANGSIMTNILKGILDFILRSSGKQQRVRMNLYVALLHYLQISLEASKSSDSKRNGNDDMSVLYSYGDIIMDVICRDACDAPDIGMTLAFTVLDVIVSMDWQKRWIDYLDVKGYLRHFIEGVVRSDEILQTLTVSTPISMKPLYIYESKMALLARIASYERGAEAILRSGIIPMLTECKFYTTKPPEQTADDDEFFTPDAVDRHRQMLFPILEIILSIFSSLGSKHREAYSQVFQRHH